VEGGVHIVVISFIRTCIDDIFTIQLSSLFIVYELFFSDQSGNKHTFRSCSIAKSESVDPCAMTDYVSKITKGQGKVDFCETCETDLCNGSIRHSFSIMSVLVVPCFAIIISSWIGV
jgi:hypothetical protein